MKKWVADFTIRTARNSQFYPYKHGAVVESGGRVLALSVNIGKASSPQTNCSIHAEAGALKKCNEGNLYVARISRGTVGMSKPCSKCMILIRRSHIKKVFYSVNAGQWECLAA